MASSSSSCSAALGVVVSSAIAGAWHTGVASAGGDRQPHLEPVAPAPAGHVRGVAAVGPSELTHDVQAEAVATAPTRQRREALEQLSDAIRTEEHTSELQSLMRHADPASSLK